MRGISVLVVVFLSALTGCDFSKPPQEMQLVIPDSISPGAKKLVAESWPKIKKVCPGINKYSDSLQPIEITDALDMPDAKYQRATIVIKVADGQSSIPSEYRAWGHSCYIDIALDGKSAFLTKDPCISIFLDNKSDHGGSELALSLQ